jgi:hypothetical protein
LEQRAGLLAEAPETYYLTDHYRNYPVVLVRLSRIRIDQLRDHLLNHVVEILAGSYSHPIWQLATLPACWQIQPPVQRRTTLRSDMVQANGDLAITHLSLGAGVLPFDSDGMIPLLGRVADQLGVTQRTTSNEAVASS